MNYKSWQEIGYGQQEFAGNRQMDLDFMLIDVTSNSAK